MFIKIRNDNGFDECPTCAYQQSETCRFCDEADQWEEGDMDAAESDMKELLAA